MMSKYIRKKEVDTSPGVRFAQKKMFLTGVITNADEADQIISIINALKPMLKGSNDE